MSENFIKKRWKLLLNIITVIALLLLAYAVRHQLADAFGNLSKVDAWALLLIIPLEALNYHAQTKLYQGLFAALGDKIDYRFMFETALELNFVNNIFPSAGVSGVSYFGVRMRSDKITAGKATLVQLMKLGFVFVSFEVMLMLGLLLLAIGGDVNNITILVAGSLTTLLIVGTLGFAFIIGSKKRINAFFTFITQQLNHFIALFRWHEPETINIAKMQQLFNDLHENYVVFKSHYQELKVPLLYALLANLTEVLTIYVVYIAFGHWVNPGAVIIAYAVANFAGLVSVLPGGVGIYEALMTAVLATAGISAGISIPVTVMYRIVNMIIQIPPGYVFYHRTLHGNNETTSNG